MAAIDPDRMSIEELIGIAIAADDLTPKETNCPLDKVMAIGLVARDYPLADGVMALKFANDATTYDFMLRSVRSLAMKINNARNYRLKPRIDKISKNVLDYWLNDKCLSCNGVGHQAIAGSPGRAARVCPKCSGSGKKPKPWSHVMPQRPRKKTPDAIAHYESEVKRAVLVKMFHEVLLRELDRTESQVATAARRRLR